MSSTTQRPEEHPARNEESMTETAATETATAEPDQQDTEFVDSIKIGGVEVEALDGDLAGKSVQTFTSRTGRGVLTIDPSQKDWTPEQVTALGSIGIIVHGDNAVPAPFIWQFLHQCQAADLDPWMREAYLITHGKRFFDDRKNRWVDNRKFTLVTGIDGFRKKAEDTGLYRGQQGPEWRHPDPTVGWVDFWDPSWGDPIAARVGILRAGFDQPVWGVAMFKEFVPMVDEYEGYGNARRKTGEKVPTPMWKQMGANQLAKCAEAQGHRKAFPRQMRGMYEAAEMQRAQADHENSERDEKRRELARQHAAARPTVMSQQPQRAGDVAAEVVKGMDPQQDGPAAQQDTPTPTPQEMPAQEVKALLLKELRFQAKAIGQPVETLGKRVVERAGAGSVDDLTPSALGPLVMDLRQGVATAIARADKPLADAYGAFVGVERPVDVDTLMGAEGDSEPTEGQTAEEIDPAAPHTYADVDGACKHCKGAEDDPWHI